MHITTETYTISVSVRVQSLSDDAHSAFAQHVIPPEPRRFTNRLDSKTDEIELDQQKSQHSDGEGQKSESETTVTGSVVKNKS